MNEQGHLRVGGAALLFLLATACTCSREREDTHERIAVTQAAPVALGYLELRDHKVTIWLGADESLYTVADKDGTVLADRVDESYLAAEFPALRDAVKGSLAADVILMTD